MSITLRMGRHGTEETLLRTEKVPSLHLKEFHKADRLGMDAEHAEDFGIDEDLLLDTEDNAGKTMEEHMADLQYLIAACGEDDLLPSDRHERPDPLTVLRNQCETVRQEVMETVREKEAMELELRRNVHALQKRIESQCNERNVLTDRLREATHKVSQKQQDMMCWEQDLRDKLCEERNRKDELEQEKRKELSDLQNHLSALSAQVSKDWAEQVELIKRLDAKSAEHAQLRDRLDVERQSSLQQHDLLKTEFSRAGKAVSTNPLTNEQVENDGCPPSIHSLCPSGMFQPVMGMSPQEGASKKVEDLRQQLEHDQKRYQENYITLEKRKRELDEQTKTVAYDTVCHRKTLNWLKCCTDQIHKRWESAKQPPATIGSAMIGNRPLNSFQLQPRATSGSLPVNSSMSSSPTGSQHLRSVTSPSNSRCQTEIGQVLSMTESLRLHVRDVERQRPMLQCLKDQLKNRNEEVSQRMKSVEEMIQAKTKELQELQYEREQKKKEREDAIANERKLLGEVQQVKDDQKREEQLKILRNQKDKKRQELSVLKERSERLQEDVNAQRGACCMRSRASKPAPGKAIPPSRSAETIGSTGQAASPPSQTSRQQARQPLSQPDSQATSRPPPPARQASKDAQPQPSASSSAVATQNEDLSVGHPSGPSVKPGAVSGTDVLAPATGSAHQPDATLTRPPATVAAETGMPTVPETLKKSKEWRAKYSFEVCIEGEETPETLQLPECQIKDGVAWRPARTKNEAVEFLRNSKDSKDSDQKPFYLLREEGRWICLHRKEKEAEARMALTEAGVSIPTAGALPAGSPQLKPQPVERQADGRGAYTASSSSMEPAPRASGVNGDSEPYVVDKV